MVESAQIDMSNHKEIDSSVKARKSALWNNLSVAQLEQRNESDAESSARMGINFDSSNSKCKR